MLLSAWFLCSAWFGPAVGGPPPQRLGRTQRGTVRPDVATRAPFFQLPVFHDAPGPLVAPELLRPRPRDRPVPAELTGLLFPPVRKQQSPWGRGGARAVEARCGADNVTVRVDRFQLRAWTEPSLFRVGSCSASRVSSRYLFFHFRLTECDGVHQVVGGHLVYTFTLCYTPPPQGDVIRVLPFNLPIRCRYNRFHYSYKVGFRPLVQHTTFMKSIRAKRSFKLTVCNARWEPLPPGHGFDLGDPVNFVAETEALLAGERLYVDSCYATNSRAPDSVPRVDIISNYGCMTDSKRGGSRSRFWIGGTSVVKFSVDAFLFKEVSHVQFLHCSMSVGVSTSQTSKSCNFDKAMSRWEELRALPSVCSCCESTCAATGPAEKNLVSSTGWFAQQNGHRTETMSFQAEEGREDDKGEDEKHGEEENEHLKKVDEFSQTNGTVNEGVTLRLPAGDGGEQMDDPRTELMLEDGLSNQSSRERHSQMVEDSQVDQDSKQGRVSNMDSVSSLSSDVWNITSRESSAENVTGGTTRIGPGTISNFTSNVTVASDGSSVHLSPGSDTFLGTHFPPPPIADSHLGSELVWSDPESDRTAERAVNGPDEELHSLQTRGSESDQSDRPAGDPVCVHGWSGSDCDSGLEEREVLSPSQFIGPTDSTSEHKLPVSEDAISFAPAGPEFLHEEPVHSAVVTVVTGLQGLDGREVSQWTNVDGGWRFLLEHLTEPKDEWNRRSLFVDKMNRRFLQGV